MAERPAVGEQAPDFTLEGTDGSFTLSEHRGERVVLLFYPGDETPVCTKQFCSYRDNSEAFGALGVTAIGISGKDVESKRAFAQNHELNVPLLADSDCAVAKSYDAYSKLRRAPKRAVIVIDEQGVVRHRHDHTLGLDFQTVAEIRQVLESIWPPTQVSGQPA